MLRRAEFHLFKTKLPEKIGQLRPGPFIGVLQYPSFARRPVDVQDRLLHGRFVPNPC